jgi:chitodextrinase
VITPKLALKSICVFAFLFSLGQFTTMKVVHAQSVATPKNLRVTGFTDWTVSLAWDAPKSKAPASYVVQCITNGRTMTVAGTQTSATFSNGFDYNRTYSFHVYAVGSNGVWSGASNTVTATLLKDTTPAAIPVVSSTDIGPTHVDLTWTYADDDPYPRFDIYVNAQLWQGQVAGTSKRIVFLKADTTYTFTVRARDSAGNWSAMSEPYSVSTPPADPNDAEPPTMPPGLWGGIIDGANEAMVSFGNSMDNVTSQEHIRYLLYLNGVFDGATIDPYPRQFSMYLTVGIVNTIEVYAVDEAGNRSAPATMTIDMRRP